MAESASPDKLSVVIYSGDFDKIHYALAMAAAAAAIGRAVTLFFTMDACRALGTKGVWRALPVSQTEAIDGGEMDDDFKMRGVADFETLLTSCVDMGVVFMVCEMGLRARGLEGMELRGDVPVREGGLVTFLNDASRDGSVLFV